MNNSVPILLVEDGKIDVENVKRAFKINKIINPLHVTGDGEEALDYLRRRPPYTDASTAPRPGVILLDINMPKMNGIEFLKVVKEDKDLRTIPVVVLTTSQEESDLVASYKLGVAGYIVKPVDFRKFVEAVKVINLYWSFCELP
jgi:CheY-like chemotaxis protein